MLPLLSLALGALLALAAPAGAQTGETAAVITEIKPAQGPRGGEAGRGRRLAAGAAAPRAARGRRGAHHRGRERGGAALGRARDRAGRGRRGDAHGARRGRRRPGPEGQGPRRGEPGLPGGHHQGIVAGRARHPQRGAAARDPEPAQRARAAGRAGLRMARQPLRALHGAAGRPERPGGRAARGHRPALGVSRRRPRAGPEHTLHAAGHRRGPARAGGVVRAGGRRAGARAGGRSHRARAGAGNGGAADLEGGDAGGAPRARGAPRTTRGGWWSPRSTRTATSRRSTCCWGISTPAPASPASPPNPSTKPSSC